jgi:hypothetical protein
MRGGCGDANGIGASTDRGSRVRVLALACLAVIAAMAVIASPAFAIEMRPYTGLSFGPDGAAGTQTFANLRSVAIDQASGEVYAYDKGVNSIYKFDANGEPVKFSALPGNAIEGIGGAEAGAEFEVAIAPPGAPGGTAGDIYVANNEIVKVYAPGGTQLGTLGEGETCGVAVNPSGHLFIGTYPDTVREYVPSADPPTNADLKASGTANVALCNVAADGAGNVYAAKYTGEKIAQLEGIADPSPTLIEPGAPTIGVDPTSNHLFANRGSLVAEYGPNGTLLGTFGAGQLSGSGGVAINSAADEVYVGDNAGGGGGGGKVKVFSEPVVVPEVTAEAASGLSGPQATLHGTVNPAGLAVEECEFEYGTTPALGQSKACVGAIPTDEADHPVTAALSDLAPGTTYYFRLAAKNANGTNSSTRLEFATPKAATVASERTRGVGVSEATLEAKVEPHGLPTSYRFEYGSDTSYGISTPEATLEEAQGVQAIAETLTGLVPGATYHWRLVVTDVFGPITGPGHTFTTIGSLVEPKTDCPNQIFRTYSLSARLADCRAFEQASPTDKNGANIQHEVGVIQASADGNRVSFADAAGLPVTGGAAKNYVAARLGDRWSTNGLVPLGEPGNGAGAILSGWDEELKTTFGEVRSGDGYSFYLGEIATGTYAPVGPDLPLEAQATLPDVAEDTEHLIFESRRALLPGAVSGPDNLYNLDRGVLTLASRVPPGSATSCDDTGPASCVPAENGSFAGPYAWQENSLEFGGARDRFYTENTLSDDGSRAIFTTAGDGKLYIREDGTTTTQISAPQRSTPDQNGAKPAAFVAATPDDSKVFFLSCEKLTDDSTAVSTESDSCIEKPSEQDLQGQDLYLYEPESGTLSDLSVDPNLSDPLGADVVGVLGASEDGSYVYFAANGVLAPGASLGTCPSGHADGTFSSAICNIYVEHEGTLALVAPIAAGGSRGQSERFSGGSENWQALSSGVERGAKSSRVSADGTLLFDSTQRLTGYDNSCDQGDCAELFRYTPTNKALHCVSCSPTGESPAGTARLGSEGKIFLSEIKNAFLTRNLSSDGNRVFFDSPDALVPEDVNGVADPYEWEAVGTGSCVTGNADGGCLSLLSTGTDPRPSFFGDASKSGEDVFIFTNQSLVPADRDELTDAYDVKVDGGLSSQNSLPPLPCRGDACKGQSTAPGSAPSPGTATFRGPGNGTEQKTSCKKRGARGKKAQAKRCGKQKKHRKRHKPPKQGKSRASNHKRGGAK